MLICHILGAPPTCKLGLISKILYIEVFKLYRKYIKETKPLLLPNQYVKSTENIIGGCAITRDECTTGLPTLKVCLSVSNVFVKSKTRKKKRFSKLLVDESEKKCRDKETSTNFYCFFTCLFIRTSV